MDSHDLIAIREYNSEWQNCIKVSNDCKNQVASTMNRKLHTDVKVNSEC